MSQFHLCGLGLVDEGGQRPAASTTSTSRMLTAGPRDTEIAAAILAGAAAIFQRGRQTRLVRSVGPSLPSADCSDRWDRGLELGSRTIDRVSV
jgi:hypothetical protein